MIANISKWGNSLAIWIPPNFVNKNNFTEASEVDITVVNETLRIKPKKRSKYSLDELVEQITLDNVHSEIVSGVTVGNEIL